MVPAPRGEEDRVCTRDHARLRRCARCEPEGCRDIVHGHGTGELVRRRPILCFAARRLTVRPSAAQRVGYTGKTMNDVTIFNAETTAARIPLEALVKALEAGFAAGCELPDRPHPTGERPGEPDAPQLAVHPRSKDTKSTVG